MSAAPVFEAAAPEPESRSLRRVAYVVSRFPKVSETFVLYELLAVEALGVEVELFPLRREPASVVHPEARPLVERAHYQPLVSGAIVRSHLQFLRRRPRAYLGALAAGLRANAGSPRFLAAFVAYFPKVVHFARLMEERDVEHVHCHFASHPAAAGFVVRRLTGIPFSFTAHGSDVHVDRHMMREKVAEASFVAAISGFNRDVIVDECGDRWRDKVALVHTGVDTDVFRPGTQRGDPGPLRVVCIGTLHEVKGQAYLLEACALLARGGLDVVCHLVGDGPDREPLERLVHERGLGGRVVFEGARTRDEVADLLARADVLAAPSVPSSDGRREGIPVALMEGMSAGLPVVASRLSGIPELVEDGRTGLLFPPGNVEALAHALRRLTEQPDLRARLGAQARETVRAEFDVWRNAEELVRLMERSRA